MVPAAVLAFNILSLLGFLLLILVFLTACLSPTVKRVSTWYSYIISWTIFCITAFVVLGHQAPGDPPPSFALCVVDSALMYASRPFAGFATLALILHLYLNISTRLKNADGYVRREHVIALLGFPPAVYILMFLYTLILGIRTPDQVELEVGGFYCHIASQTPAIVGAALVVLGTSVSLIIEVLIAILLSRNWRAFRALQRCNEHTVSLSIILRVSIFGLIPAVGLILTFATYEQTLQNRIWSTYNILIALLPLAAALVFGSQWDLIKVWMFWRRSRVSRWSRSTRVPNARAAAPTDSGMPFFVIGPGMHPEEWEGGGKVV
ncbi:hypothetical protein FB45DRAFT_123834 [Roridomyces roridus]|uniref:Uncharacterized protein n=1 Tax=Roridomyces roridus TaxID=1738132 RepID=A0AAD7FJD5_9AGAR|nr:hypothetical protein FB45DRAFT_123834 [Roridomyces roridus]